MTANPVPAPPASAGPNHLAAPWTSPRSAPFRTSVEAALLWLAAEAAAGRLLDRLTEAGIRGVPCSSGLCLIAAALYRLTGAEWCVSPDEQAVRQYGDVDQVPVYLPKRLTSLAKRFDACNDDQLSWFVFDEDPGALDRVPTLIRLAGLAAPAGVSA
jgi:hypothetical protein